MYKHKFADVRNPLNGVSSVPINVQNNYMLVVNLAHFYYVAITVIKFCNHNV